MSTALVFFLGFCVMLTVGIYLSEKRNEKDTKEKLKQNEIVRRTYVNKYEIPVDREVIDVINFNNFSDITLDKVRKFCIWKSNDMIYLVEDDIYSKLPKIIIPIDNIINFIRLGDMYSYTNVEGNGGGSSLKGAAVGGILAGSAGAIIGSRKNVEMKVENVVNDERTTILEVKGNDKICYLQFGAEAYLALLKLIPNKEANIVSNKEIHCDIYAQIDKLAELRERNILSEEEFQEKKNILLDKIK